MQKRLQDTFIEHVQKYARIGILLDTNILLVYIIGQYDPARIQTFKRTNTFTANDYKVLAEFLLNFDTIVTTPHVLTEVSNLAAHLNEPIKTACFKSFANNIQRFNEQTEAAARVAATSAFTRLGITDASLSLIARHKFLVLTDDLVLYAHLLESNVDAINFNHIRPLGPET